MAHPRRKRLRKHKPRLFGVGVEPIVRKPLFSFNVISFFIPQWDSLGGWDRFYYCLGFAVVFLCLFALYLELSILFVHYSDLYYAHKQKSNSKCYKYIGKNYDFLCRFLRLSGKIDK